MTLLLILAVSGAVLVLAGRFYSRFLARQVGEDPSRTTPAVRFNDGRDYVPSPTPVVFAHHFATIAGAGPIVGPVIAIVYGWLPALVWVLGGAVLFGAVHDYLAAYMATREGGQSVAVIARRLVGGDAFVALTLFLIVMLALVCGAFLNLSAAALTSMVSVGQLDMSMSDAGLLRVRDGRAIVGGIASTSVIVITAFAPLVGYLYVRRKVAVWKCSLLAVGVCALSIAAGLRFPVALDGLTWKLLLSAYVLVAAGAPVWLLLQSRDFINVHILYVGTALLLAVLLVAGLLGARRVEPAARLGPADDEQTTALLKGAGAKSDASAVEGFNRQVRRLDDMGLGRAVGPLSVTAGQELIGEGNQALGGVWPMLLITIACGAVSGFHALCAGGTTCKQLVSEPAVRKVAYYAMLLESFVAVCVIGVCIVGLDVLGYLTQVHPGFMALTRPDGKPMDSNAVLAFALAVGWTGKLALGAPIVVGTLAGMILLEGFLVTTLDSAVRLARYLIEEVWRIIFARYDVFAAPVGMAPSPAYGTGAAAPLVAQASRLCPAGRQPQARRLCYQSESAPPPAAPVTTRGLARAGLTVLRHYWFNSGIAVGLMLLFALTGGVKALWGIFATANQLLAAMVLSLASIWLLRRPARTPGRKPRVWFAFVPAVVMLATTGTSLVLLLVTYLKNPARFATLLAADLAIMAITAYLLYAGIRAAVAALAAGRQPPPTASGPIKELTPPQASKRS